MKPSIFTALLTIISFAGLGITIFLIFQHYIGSSICDISSFLSCTTVNTSRYSQVFGVPVAFFGTGYFVLMIVLFGLYERHRKLLNYAFYLSLIALVPSFTLTYIEFFVLNAVCIFCESTKVLIVLIAFLTYMQRKAQTLAS